MLVQTSIASTDACVKASLNVRTAEAKVGFFLKKFREAKSAHDDADVRTTIATPMFE